MGLHEATSVRLTSFLGLVGSVRRDESDLRLVGAAAPLWNLRIGS